MKTSPRTLPAVTLLVGVLLGGATGGAVAGGVITGADIKNNSVTGQDIKNKSLGTEDLSAKAVKGLQGAAGPAGPAGATGPAGPVKAVRAYGLLNSGTTVTKQSGGITATAPYAGIRCLTVPGVDPNQAAMVVTGDWATNTGGVNKLELAYSNTGLNCPAGTFSIITLYQTPGANAAPENAPVYFVIP